MRRWVLLCLVLLMPLQAVWSAVSAFDLQDLPCRAAMAFPQGDADPADDVADVGPCCGDRCDGCRDCPLCDELGTAALISVHASPFSAPPRGPQTGCEAEGRPDHVPAQLLRPPPPAALR